MTNHTLLNNVEHKDLKVITEKSDKYGNDIMFSMLYPFEFKHAQTEYPIFFHKDNQSGNFTPLALFGFEQKENLFLHEGEWQASYIPFMVEREPFLIGMHGDNENGNPMIHIDLDSPRVSETEGTELFLPHGGNSEYINRISNILKTLHDAKDSTNAFLNTLTELELLEPFNLDISLNNGSNHRLTGFYTLNEDRVSQLPADVLVELNQSGMLMLMYMVIASHANINKLIQKKERTLA